MKRHHGIVSTGSDHGATGGEAGWRIEQAQFDGASVATANGGDGRHHGSTCWNVERVERNAQRVWGGTRLHRDAVGMLAAATAVQIFDDERVIAVRGSLERDRAFVCS